MPGPRKRAPKTITVALPEPDPEEVNSGFAEVSAAADAALAPRKKWRLTWGEHSWTEDDLTGAELCELSVLLGSDWRQMTPTTGPLQLVGFLTVFVARETGEKFPKVMGRIKSVKASDLVDALTLE